MTKYFSEKDVELFQAFNIDLGEALDKPKLVGQDLWHFRPVGDDNPNATAKLNMRTVEGRAARVAELKTQYAKWGMYRISPFDVDNALSEVE